MDDFELPDDLKDDTEIIYLDDDEEIEEIEEDETGSEIQAEVVDLAKLSFNKHTQSVFSCHLNKDGTLAITGGQDDIAYVWETATGNVMLECTGHKDSVTEVRFNHDCSLVATGDMAGLVQVWNVHEKKLIWCNDVDDMDWLHWHPATNALVVGTQSGDTYVWQVPQGNCKVLPSHGQPSTCGRLLPDGKRLLVGYGDGQVKLWDIKGASIEWQLSEPLAAGVTDLAVTADGSIIAVAPTATLLKAVDGKTISNLLVDGEQEVESILFHSDLGVLITGSLSGQLCVWDVARRSLRHQACIECAVTVLHLTNDGHLAVGATDGAIYLCNVRTGQLVHTLTGHLADILCISPAQSGPHILTSSDDCSAKIFSWPASAAGN